MGRLSSLYPVIAILLMLVSAPTVLADVGPPPQQPGSSIAIGDFTTNVQMIAEDVLLTLDADSYQGHITASFWMQNQGQELESFDVYFPLGQGTDYGHSDEPWIIQVQHFAAWVNGTPAQVEIEELDDEFQIWVHWPVIFPPGETVIIEVAYDIEPEYVAVAPLHHTLGYILETGAGWWGSIGEATITIRFPYPIDDPGDVLGIEDNLTYIAEPSGYTIFGTDLIWHFADLGPTSDDNIRLDLRPAATRVAGDQDHISGSELRSQFAGCAPAVCQGPG